MRPQLAGNRRRPEAWFLRFLTPEGDSPTVHAEEPTSLGHPLYTAALRDHPEVHVTRLTQTIRRAFHPLGDRRFGPFLQRGPRFLTDVMRTRGFWTGRHRPSPPRKLIEAELFHLDMTTVVLAAFVGAAANHARQNGRLVAHDIEPSLRMRVPLAIEALAKAIVAGLGTARHAVEQDSLVPLRALRRHHVELSMLLLACLADKQFMRHYVSWVQDDGEESSRHWRKVRPAVARRIIAKALAERVRVLQHNDLLHEILEQQYQWLSRFAHGHPVALSVASVHLSDMELPVVSELQQFAQFNFVLVAGLVSLAEDHGWEVHGLNEPGYFFHSVAALHQLVSLEMASESLGAGDEVA